MLTEIGLASREGEYLNLDVKELNSERFEDTVKASHCMIYAKDDSVVMGSYEAKARVLMQMRFDGQLGFPGGVVDQGENALTGLNRELWEETCLDPGQYGVKNEDILCLHYSRDKNLLLAFYTLEVTSKEFSQIERRILDAPEYGDEVLGSIRVPLYTMDDGYRGLPAFLSNRFIGNSKQQLLRALKEKEILTEDEIDIALRARPVFVKPTLAL